MCHTVHTWSPYTSGVFQVSFIQSTLSKKGTLKKKVIMNCQTTKIRSTISNHVYKEIHYTNFVDV